MTELCAECIVKDFTVIHQIENLFKGGYNWIDLWTLCKGDKSLTVSLKSIPFGKGSPEERTLMSKYSTLISTNNGRIIFHRICQLQNYVISIFSIDAIYWNKNQIPLEQEAETSMAFDHTFLFIDKFLSMYLSFYHFYFQEVYGWLWQLFSSPSTTNENLFSYRHGAAKLKLIVIISKIS